MNGRTNSSDVTIQEINYGALIPLEAATNLQIVRGDASAYLSWTDPVDKYANPGGDLVAEFDHTLVIRKENTAPTSPTDGTVILKTTSRDQYKTEMFHDTGLTNRQLYYYGIYPYTTYGVPSTGINANTLPSDGNAVYLKDIEFVSLGGAIPSHGDVTATVRYQMAAAPTYNHLIFSGGQVSGPKNSSDYEYGIVRLTDAYDSVTLTKTAIANAPVSAAEMKSVSNGKYAIFAGGKSEPYYRPDRNTTAYAYDDNLSMIKSFSNISLGGAYGDSMWPASISSDTYAMFGGGGSSRSETDIVHIFNTSLTYQTKTLQQKRYMLGGGIAGSNYVFAGGGWYAGTSNDNNLLVDAFNSSLTKINISNLSSAFQYASTTSGGTIGEYAIFFSVYGSTTSGQQETPVTEAFDLNLSLIDSSMIMQLPPEAEHSGMSIGQSNTPGITFGNYVYFQYRIPSQVVFAKYDKNLTASKIKISELIPDVDIADDMGMGVVSSLNCFDIVGTKNNRYALACFTVPSYTLTDADLNRMAVLTI